MGTKISSSVLPSLALTMVLLGMTSLLLPTTNGQLDPTAIFQSLQGTFQTLRNNVRGNGGGVNGGGSSKRSSVSGTDENSINLSQYKGSNVGPLALFRSSDDNAKIVNDGLIEMPVFHFLGLAFGDEFPQVRDAVITQTKSGSVGLRQLVTNFGIWRYNRDNNKNEVKEPYTGKVPSLSFSPGNVPVASADSASPAAPVTTTTDRSTTTSS